MTLSINKKYTRSVNLERDISSQEVSSTYIPTARAMHVLERFVKTINTDDNTRAWTLVGPYGSGKSSFGLFLNSILGNAENSQTKQALININKRNFGLAQRLTSSIEGKTKEALSIVLTGSPEPFASAFAKALKAGVERFFNKRGRRPGFYYTISNWKMTPSTSEIMSVIKDIQSSLISNKKTPCKGILIVIDELGKFLEYEARHQTANDIYLLQELAEHAYKGAEANIFIFTLTHQSFEQYASGLNKNQQEEWAKIQGRYENIPFVEPVEQTLEIVSKALDAAPPSSPVKKTIIKALAILSEQEALPAHLESKQMEDTFLACYPLHPLTALFLPLLCQKIAQNERTLFSFIGSDEPYGLANCLQQHNGSKLIYINAIYDYFIENQTANILDHYTHRRWAEVTSAISRLGEAFPEDLTVLKTIGLINIIGSRGGIKASQEILSISTPLTTKQLQESIDRLKKRSLIQFRKFNNEYRVWQGSDFDIEEALNYEINQLRSINLSDRLNASRQIPNVVANRHSIRTGTFRYFTPCFIDWETKKIPSSSHPRLLIYLAKGNETHKQILETITRGPSDVIGIFFQQEKIKRAVTEVTALQQILSNRNELNSDPVAMHEFKDRFIAAKEALNSLLLGIRLHPEEGNWFWGDQELHISNKRDFNSNLSSVLSDVYSKSPVIKNELINQDIPSAQAATARNKLMQAMLANENEEHLGIKKFPAEKAIYKAALLATGIHRLSGNKWEFGPPQPDSPYNMRAAWDCIADFLEGTKQKHKPFTLLNSKLQAPPYGIREGILPILYLAVFIHYKHELALYENGEYLPLLPQERYDLFIKRMDLFSVQLIRVEGINRSLYKQYADLFKIDEANNIQSLVKPFAQFISNLPEYTLNTRLLSPRARDIVTAYDRAQSPEDLLFNLLPQACGIAELNDESVQAFSASFREGLVEIRDAYEQLLRTLETETASAFRLSFTNLEVLRSELHSRFSYLLKHVNGSSQISSTLRFITTTKGEDREWLEKFFASLVQKRCAAWSDTDSSTALTQLKRVASSVLDIDRLYFDIVDTENTESQSSRILLKTIKPGIEHYSTVQINADALAKTQKARTEILHILNDIGDDSLQLMALAKIVDETLLKVKCNEE